MLSPKKLRASSNLKMLEFAARRLGNLNSKIVYLGGCVTALFITDPLSPDVRMTRDVDCIIDVLTLGEYHKFGQALHLKGFKQSAADEVICRWRLDDLVLDVMPTDEKILGFSNPWYRSAIKNAIDHQIAEDLVIRSVTAPYFLATKLVAFQTRGQNDFWQSHDLEDIITVLDGRVEIIDDLILSPSELTNYLRTTFTGMLQDEQFLLALPGHLNAGPVAFQRSQVVKERIQRIVNLSSG